MFVHTHDWILCDVWKFVPLPPLPTCCVVNWYSGGKLPLSEHVCAYRSLARIKAVAFNRYSNNGLLADCAEQKCLCKYTIPFPWWLCLATRDYTEMELTDEKHSHRLVWRTLVPLLGAVGIALKTSVYVTIDFNAGIHVIVSQATCNTNNVTRWNPFNFAMKQPFLTVAERRPDAFAARVGTSGALCKT